MSPRKENEIVWWAVGLRVEPMQTGAERKTLEAKKTSYKERNLEAKNGVFVQRGGCNEDGRRGRDSSLMRDSWRSSFVGDEVQ